LSPRFPFLDDPGLIPFAHRGNAAGTVENTVAAFRAVVELGYRYVETFACAGLCRPVPVRPR
jgi:glycerophosphoryl diester phosphodiesterase